MTQPDARIKKALHSLSKAYPVLVEHAPEIDGEFDKALSEVRTALAKLARIEAQEPVAWVVCNATGDLEDVDTEFAQAADTAREWDALYPSDAPHRVVALYEREVGE